MARNLERLVARYQPFETPMHESYTAWVEDQAERPGSRMQPVEYNPTKYPDQAISEPMTPVHESQLPDALFYGVLRYKVGRSIGHLSTREMLKQLKNHPVSSQDSTPLTTALINAQERRENTVVITPHFRLTELGYFKALRFLAKKDRPRINNSGALLNKLMTRQQYRGRRITDRFVNIGNLFWSSPRSRSAEKFNVPKAAQNGVNALFRAALGNKLEEGGLELDVAPTGSELKEVRGDDGNLQGFRFPEIDPASAKLIEDFDNILPASLIQHPVTKRWKMHLGELRPVEAMLEESGSAETLLDDIFTKFQAEIENYTEYETSYTKIAKATGKLALQ
jgi:hypothetical protein